LKVGITGASGYIGKKLCTELAEKGFEVFKFVRREPQKENEIYWSPSKQEIDKEKFEILDAIVHLAGESLAPKDIFGFLPLSGGRWTKEKKSRIYWSRKWASDLFMKTFNDSESYPKIFITASGTTIYGDHSDEVITEATTKFNRGTFDQLVAEEAWEEPLNQLQKTDVRVVKARNGFILGKGNIATQLITLTTKLNISGPLGKGTQFWSWISIEDVINAYIFCLENHDVSGPVNFVSPVPMEQKEFSSRFAKVFKKLSIIPAPQLAINLLMGSELAHGLIFCSLRIIPEKLLKEGFEFQYPLIEDYAKALKDE
jgi:uncharacterized protein (TIGR01777 family)